MIGENADEVCTANRIIGELVVDEADACPMEFLGSNLTGATCLQNWVGVRFVFLV